MQTAKELYQALNEAKTVPERVEVLRKLGFLFLNRDPERCNSVAQELFLVSESPLYKPGMVHGHLTLARLHHRQARYNKALEQLKEALLFFRNGYDDLFLLAKVMDGLGMVYSSKGEIDQALQAHQEAIKLYREGNEPEGLEANCLNNIANCYGRKGDFEQSERYYRMALSLLNERGNERYGTNMRANLAMLMNEKGKHEEALSQLMQCLQEFEVTDNSVGQANIILHLGHTHRHRNDYAEAIKCYMEAMKRLKHFDNQEAIASCYRGLGQVYNAFKGYHDAVLCLEQAIIIYKQIGYASGLVDALEMLADMHFQAGMQQLAKECLQEANAIAEDKALEVKIQSLARLNARMFGD